VVVELGVTVIVPPEYGRVYEVPLEPVTWIEAALDSVTVSVSDCPAEILLELAVMETVGMDAAALLANAEIASKVSKGARDGIVFTGGLPFN
jgi:hypothetical protein